MTDPLVTVSRIASEGVLLVVSHHFKKYSSEPDRPANVVPCAELFVFLLRVQDQGGEEREKHPNTCTEKMMSVNFTLPERDVLRLVCNSSIGAKLTLHSPVDEEAGGVIPDAVEPAVMTLFQHSEEEKQTQPYSPRAHQP